MINSAAINKKRLSRRYSTTLSLLVSIESNSSVGVYLNGRASLTTHGVGAGPFVERKTSTTYNRSGYELIFDVVSICPATGTKVNLYTPQHQELQKRGFAYLRYLMTEFEM